MNQRLVQSEGMSLVEVLVAAALLGLLVVGVSAFFTYSARQTATQERMNTMVNLRGLLQGYVQNGAVIQASATAGKPGGVYASTNGALWDCIDENAGSPDCTDMSAATVGTGFYLTTSRDAPAADVVGGPDNDPVYYDKTGRKCTAAENPATNVKCSIRVITRFFSYCSAGMPNCKAAQNIKVTFDVQNVNL